MNEQRRKVVDQVYRTIDAVRTFPMAPDTRVIIDQHGSGGGSVSLFPSSLAEAVEHVRWLTGLSPTLRHHMARAVSGTYDDVMFHVYAPVGSTAAEVLDGLDSEKASA